MSENVKIKRRYYSHCKGFIYK